MRGAAAGGGGGLGMEASAGPPPRHVRVAETPDGLRIVIPGRWTLEALVVGAGALFFVFAFAQTSAAFVVIAIALWALLAWIAPGVAFGPLGTEVILIDGATLTRWHEVAGRALGHRRFQFDLVRHIRATYVPDVPGQALSRAWRRTGPPPPCIAFDYGVEDVQFAVGLEEADADYVVAAIGRRFPGATGWPPGAGDPSAEGS